MTQRSSIIALVLSAIALAVAAAFQGQAEPAPALTEETPAFKAIVPELQKELAAGKWKHVRLDDVKLDKARQPRAVAFQGVWLYETTAPTADEQKALHDWLRTRSKELLKKKLNAGAKPDPKIDKEIDELGHVETGIEAVKSPVHALRAAATEHNQLRGAVLADLSYAADGKLQLAGYVAREKADEQKKLIGGLLRDAAIVPPLVLGTKAGKAVEPSLAELKAADYDALRKRMQAEFAAAKENTVTARTRLDDAAFQYVKGDAGGVVLVLEWRGVCLQDPADQKNVEKARSQLKDALKKLPAGVLPEPVPEKYDTDVRHIVFRASPVVALQAKAGADPRMDGVLFVAARFDKDGRLEIDYLGSEAQKPLVEQLLKDAGEEAIARPQGTDWPQKGGSWTKLLEELRKQFAADAKDALFRQTRVDRVHFEYVGDEPRLHCELIVLQPKGDPAALRTRLEQRLEGYFADKLKRPGGGAFKVVLPALPFQPDPTPALQRLAATDPALDGVLFESARFDAARRLNFDVIYDDKAGQEEKIRKLFAANTIGRKLLMPALASDDPAQEPRLNPKTFVRWEEQRQALQRDFAASREALLEATRIDRLYFTYEGNEISDRQLRVAGVCLQAGVAADLQKALAKAIQTRWQPRFPGVEFRTIADGITLLTSPVVGLQALAVDRRDDGVLFERAVYDGDGKLHLRAYLANLTQRPAVAEPAAAPAVGEVVRPALGTKAGQDGMVVDPPRPFPWRGEGREGAGLVERFQRHFAASDVRAARQSRLDRAYFLYDKQAVRQLHLEGVCLWDGLPKATVPEALTPVCRQVLSDIAYQVVADRLARKPNPAPALQEKLAGKPEFDGVLFEDVGFDAQGRLQFDVLLAPGEAQRTEVDRLLRDPPLADGVLPADPARRELRIVLRPFDWDGMLRTVRAWAAGPTSPPEARRTRLDRAYFARPDGGCEFHLVGVSLVSAPEGDVAAAAAARTRIALALGKQCLSHLTPFKLKLPEEPKPLARAIVLAKRGLLSVLRGSISEQRAMDGINLTDVVFDGAGRVALEGHWLGEGQARDLGAALREALQPEARALTREGTSLERLRIVRTDLLLRDLRKWLVERTEVEEVLFDRLFFDAQGKLRIAGFFTRPPDKEAAEKAGLEGLLAYPIGRALLGLDPDGIVKPDMQGKEVVHLVQRPSLVQWLRREVPADPTLDGIRVDRCTYDADTVFVLNGLEDGAGQSRRLKGLLDTARNSPAFGAHLAHDWRLGKFTAVPARRLLRCLTRLMPIDPIFDGMALDRLYHGAGNHLVITGAATGARRRDKAEKVLADMIAAEPDWRLRLSYGGPDFAFKLQAADLPLAQRAYERAVLLYGHERKAARALADLDTTLLHNPTDGTAWYFRAVCYLALGDEAAAERDLRRVLALSRGRPPLVDQVIDYVRLELVQGRHRARASQLGEKIALALPGEKALAALVKELCADPPPPPPPEPPPEAASPVFPPIRWRFDPVCWPW